MESKAIINAKADFHYAEKAYEFTLEVFLGLEEGHPQKKNAQVAMESARASKNCLAYSLECLQKEAVCDARR